MINKSLLFLLLLLLSLGLPTQALKAAPIDINANETIDVSKNLEWCATDPTLEIEIVRSGGCQFIGVRDAKELPLGTSAKAFWLRFSLENKSSAISRTWLRVGHPRLQSVSLYALDTENSWTKNATGFDIPADKKPILTEYPILPIELPAHTTKIYYVNVKSETVIDLTPVLLTPSAYIKSTQLSRLISHMSLGAIGLASILCLIIYAAFRDKGVLFFALTLFSVMIIDAGYTGLIATHFWPKDIPFDFRISLVANFCGLLFFSAFILSFLPHSPRLTNIKLATYALLGAMFFSTVYGLTTSLRDALPYILSSATGATVSLVILVVITWKWENAAPLLLLWGICPLFIMIMFRLTTLMGFTNYLFTNSSGFAWTLALMSPIIISSILQRAEKQRREVQKHALEASLRTQFLAHMSHDLRTPLNTIIGYADLVSRGSSRVTIKDAMTAIKGSGHDLIKMIDGILDYVRVEAQEITLTQDQTILMPFLEQTATRAKRLGLLNHNSFEVEFSADIPTAVLVDELRLKQVLDNILSNAHHYTQNGKVIFTCDAKEIEKDTCLLMFSVIDTGPGIDPEDQERIFEPFVRGKAARYSDKGGAGIGLALCQKIIHLMDGEIKVSSTLGRGSTFSFTIRCPVIKTLGRQQTDGKLSTAQCTILLVDDDQSALNLLESSLREYDVQIFKANSSKTANTYWENSISLVITDQFMTDGDGWSVLREAAQRNIPAILISAAEPQRPFQLSESIQFSAFFQKPYDFSDLISETEKIIGCLTPLKIPPTEINEIEIKAPGDELVRPLRQMIREGAVTAIETWVEETKILHPEHEAFLSAVGAAIRKLDFVGLQALVVQTSLEQLPNNSAPDMK